MQSAYRLAQIAANARPATFSQNARSSLLRMTAVLVGTSRAPTKGLNSYATARSLSPAGMHGFKRLILPSLADTLGATNGAASKLCEVQGQTPRSTSFNTAQRSSSCTGGGAGL